MHREPARVCIFDVNGVLIDSNAANALAMAEVFTGDPTLQKRIAELYLRLTGIDRGKKIRIIQEQIIGTPFGEKEFDVRWERFKELARLSMGRAPLMPGVVEVLTTLGNNRVIRAALSNTPFSELCEILALHRVEGLLDIIRGGGDWPKSESLMRLLREFDFKPRDCLFFGDGKGDLAAARHAGVPFVAIDPGTGEFTNETGFQGPCRNLAEWGEMVLGVPTVAKS